MNNNIKNTIYDRFTFVKKGTNFYDKDGNKIDIEKENLNNESQYQIGDVVVLKNTDDTVIITKKNYELHGNIVSQYVGTLIDDKDRNILFNSNDVSYKITDYNSENSRNMTR